MLLIFSILFFGGFSWFFVGIFYLPINCAQETVDLISASCCASDISFYDLLILLIDE